MTIEIILMAMIAAFLGLRLYSVLGKRTGHEQEPMMRKPIEERTPPAPREPAPHQPVLRPQQQGEAVDINPVSESGLRAIMNADTTFDPALFVEGAKSAYGMVLEAFWKGDKDALKNLCDDDVYEEFAAAIDAREERGEVLDNRLVRIETARIVDASIDHPTARITVHFDADIAAVVKDKDGNIIGGSMDDAVETHDKWTFMRDVKSASRNWTLDETDEA